ncbi:8330_t:CDS:2 [Gigaspora margarita]|uniref:8330_t:CDS:1 n=1 Tax=Gigaspora margarita TaxID=4874 RepID=A0ABN7UZ94_GIGMA|nr:8330_t:CDS:2 [Gigaspora margarita]
MGSVEKEKSVVGEVSSCVGNRIVLRNNNSYQIGSCLERGLSRKWLLKMCYVREDFCYIEIVLENNCYE